VRNYGKHNNRFLNQVKYLFKCKITFTFENSGTAFRMEEGGGSELEQAHQFKYNRGKKEVMDGKKCYYYPYLLVVIIIVVILIMCLSKKYNLLAEGLFFLKKGDFFSKVFNLGERSHILGKALLLPKTVNLLPLTIIFLINIFMFLMFLSLKCRLFSITLGNVLFFSMFLSLIKLYTQLPYLKNFFHFSSIFLSIKCILNYLKSAIASILKVCCLLLML